MDDRDKNSDLTYRNLEVACKNIGFDITCGGCAGLFFTGSQWDACEPTCTTVPRVDQSQGKILLGIATFTGVIGMFEAIRQRFCFVESQTCTRCGYAYGYFEQRGEELLCSWCVDKEDGRVPFI